MHFNLVDLSVFTCIAESPSLTQGAKKAFISPAAASTRIKALESQLGCRLFYRHNRGLDLTPAGTRLLQHARLVLRQVDNIKDEFSGYASDQSGHLRIYANSTAVTEYLPELLANFLAERPKVTIDLQEHSTRNIFRGVLESSADIGIVAGDVLNTPLQAIHFSTDRLAVVTGRAHPLTQNKKISFKDILDYPFISLHQGSSLFAFLNEQIEQQGRSLSTRIHVSSFEAMCRLIEAGVGIGIMPESAAQRHKKNLNIQQITLNEPWATRERNIVIKEEAALTPLARVLIDTIVKRMAH